MRAKKFTSSPNYRTFLPTSQIIKMAKDAGADFGAGDPNERIRYFIKLSILPHMVRKVPTIQFSRQNPKRSRRGDGGPSQTIGHLPYSAVNTLIKVNSLSNRGFSYPQIAQKLIEKKQAEIKPKKQPVNSQPIAKLSRPIHILERVGLDEKKLASKINKTKVVVIGAASIFVIGLLTSTGVYLALKKDSPLRKGESLTIDETSRRLGQVLAASSAGHKLYVDANSQFSGTTVFAEDITAPNVLYGAVGGTGISVSTGQTPTISLDATGVVTRDNPPSTAPTNFSA